MNDMEYLNWVVMETFRIQSPVAVTSWLRLTQDAKICDINFKKDEQFTVNFYACHYNGE